MIDGNMFDYKSMLLLHYSLLPSPAEDSHSESPSGLSDIVSELSAPLACTTRININYCQLLSRVKRLCISTTIALKCYISIYFLLSFHCVCLPKQTYLKIIHIIFTSWNRHINYSCFVCQLNWHLNRTATNNKSAQLIAWIISHYVHTTGLELHWSTGIRFY